MAHGPKYVSIQKCLLYQTVPGIVNMADPMNLLEPLINLIDNEDIKDTVRETARNYYNETGVTVNLIPSIIIGLLALLGVLCLESPSLLALI